MDYITKDDRIYVCDDGKMLAEVTFPKIDEQTVDINHTFVDESLRGNGVASKLLLLAYESIKRQDLKAIATCSYAIYFFEQNEAYRDILK